MPRYNTLVFAGLLIALSGAQLAPAQTSAVAHLAVQSGNGQVACICRTATIQAFQPISVLATDAHGNPVAGATVNWTAINPTPSIGTGILLNVAHPTSVTGANGVATEGDPTNPLTNPGISYQILVNFTSTAVPFLVGSVQATSNNNSVIFTETQSLIEITGDSVISSAIPTFNGQSLGESTLSANAGSTLSTPILVQVGGLDQASNGVANVSVRIVNEQTSPTLTCANSGGYADPGSVLTNAQGLATCFPVFSGSGSGTFYVLVGGVPASDISTALDLQSFPSYNGSGSAGYAFTSVPGAPVAFQIVSGNNQVGNIGQTLNPLVAKLVDANGNAVGGQTVVWSVIPAGAVALSNTATQTDNNGLISQTLSLDILASAGAQITVAVQSNPTISATFQETVLGAITGMTKISGDGQSAQIGTTFPTQLVVQLTNASGPVRAYPVQYQVNGQVTLVEGTTIDTDMNGRATVTAKAGSLAGTATVTAVAGALSQSFSLTITSTPTVVPTGMTNVSGNPQSAIVNTAFALPLVVQVNSATGPISGYVVSFSSSGPVSISSAAATTNSAGQASINVTAGASTGTATVTASISGFSQVFNLTVTPIGPNITASSFLNAASGQIGAISPCGLATISASGLAPNGVNSLAPAPIFGRLPLAVNNLSVTFAGTLAPIVNVAMGSTNPQVTLQVPCEVTPGSSVPVVVNVGGGTATTNVAVQTVSPGIFQTVMSDGTSRAVVVRDDGSFADIGTAFPNPARLGERARIYITGAGPTVPAVGTDRIQDPNADLFGTDANIAGSVQVNISGVGAQVVSARLAPDLIGVYEIQFLIPSGAQTGNNVVISVLVTPVGGATATQSLNSTIPIQ